MGCFQIFDEGVCSIFPVPVQENELPRTLSRRLNTAFIGLRIKRPCLFPTPVIISHASTINTRFILPSFVCSLYHDILIMQALCAWLRS